MIRLIANYSKRLGLPGYSSHQFSITLETELIHTEDVANESARIYELLQHNVDAQLQNPGFVPPTDYAMEGSPASNGESNRSNLSTAQATWRCTHRQRELIESLLSEHQLDQNEVDHLARQRFGKGVRELNKVEASGLIDELIETHGGQNRSATNGRRSAYAGVNGNGGRR